MRNTIVLLAVVSLLLTGCTITQQSSDTPGEKTEPRSVGAPQKTTGGTLTVNGRERSYRLSTPDGFYRARQWPVIFAFHGWKESATSLAETTGLDEAQAIVIYPDGVDHAWAPAPYAKTSGAEDLDFVQALLDDVVSTFPVDRNQIFATGFSNGGGFAAYLGCHLPETFHAVATVGAAYYEEINENCTDRPVAHLDIHGTHDPVISYNGGRRHGTPYDPVQVVLGGVAHRNDCEGGVSITRKSLEVIEQHWQGCRLPLIHLRVGGGTHVWPDNATSEVRNFFGV